MQSTSDLQTPSSTAANSSRVVAREELASSRWLRLVNLQYTTDGGSSVKSWQAAERTTTKAGEVDAVAAFSVIKKRGLPPRLLIVKQFRPAVGKFTVELCAGLVDPGESLEVAALRELKEETGYSGTVVGKTGRQYLSPGLTPENIVTLFVEIDGDAPENQTPVQQDEDAGLIIYETLSLTDLMEELERLESEGYAIWVGLWNIAQGMRLRSLMPDLGL